MTSRIIGDNIIKEVKSDNCFDFLRYFFAISLIIAHFFTLTERLSNIDKIHFIFNRQTWKYFFANIIMAN